MKPVITTEKRWHCDSLQPLVYRLYGLNLKSNFKFTHHLTTLTGKSNLIFKCIDSPPVSQDWQDTSPLFPAFGEPDLGVHFYPQNGFDILHLPGSGDFYIWSEQILCHPTTPVNTAQLEIDFLGTVLSFWLERQGIPALHASAVVLQKDCAVGFLASSQGGKSSLASALVQSGYALLTDDILPVECRDDLVIGRPGYAQMRFWPDRAEYLLGQYHNLAKVHPDYDKRRVPIGLDGWGNFCDTAQQLKCLYLPERRDPSAWGTAVEIISVSPTEAVIELVRQSFAAPILRAMGILPQRLENLAKIVRHVPVRRLIYPNGMNYLPQVNEAIKADLL